ncbi:hypothetical protein ABXS75_00380 [Roseburia hominis]
MALTGIVGNLAGGKVIDTFGIFTLTTGCGFLIVLLTIIFGVSQYVWKKTDNI